MNNELVDVIKRLLNDGGYVQGVKFAHFKNQPSEAKFIFKKLTAKEITFFQKQLVLLNNTDNSV